MTDEETHITCREVVELVTDYLEGTMPAEDRARFEEHLTQCDGCERYVDQMRTTIRAAQATAEDDLSEVPPEQLDQLVDAFRDWKRG